MTPFSMELKKLRHDRRLTQKEVAESIGISQGNYSGLESGRYEPSLSTLISISNYFGVWIDDIVGNKVIVTDDYQLTAEEEEWVDFYRKMSLPERSLARGMVSVIEQQRNDCFAFLPTDMNIMDFHEDNKASDDQDNDEDDD